MTVISLGNVIELTVVFIEASRFAISEPLDYIYTFETCLSPNNMFVPMLSPMHTMKVLGERR
jgi:hypothetical protein